MCVDAPRLGRASWRPSGVWWLATLLLACNSPKPAPPRAGDATAVRRWLLCEECYHGELDSLLDPARRDSAVPLLAAALNGPPPGRRDNVRRQLEETYQELALRAAKEGRALPRTREEYVAHFLGNYEAVYQSRAVIGLAAIATPEAKAALEDAAARVQSGELIYRGDVVAELSRVTKPLPPPGSIAWVAIAAGLLRTCGISSDGQSYCWGRNDLGQLGDGTIATRPVPTLVAGNLGFSTIAASEEGWHTCGIAGERAYCWGSNARGELGDGTTAHQSVPVPVAGGLRFITVTGGGNHTCALTPTGKGYCWGGNDIGQLGDATTVNKDVPTKVEATIPFRQLSAGTVHTCAVAVDAQLYCWGETSDGQLGDGSSHPRPQPRLVAVPFRFAAVAAGGFHTCGLTRSSPASHAEIAYCTGRNTNGQLGDNSTTTRGVLREVAGGHRFVALSAGGEHTCGIESVTQAIWCWGDNEFGQLGDGSVIDRRAPVQVVGAQRFSVVSAGTRHTCGIDVQGGAYCWGGNSDGQVGDKSTTDRPAPTAVQNP